MARRTHRAPTDDRVLLMPDWAGDRVLYDEVLALAAPHRLARRHAASTGGSRGR